MKQKNYIAGLYLRLSQEDERHGESLSIENQRIMLRKYSDLWFILKIISLKFYLLESIGIEKKKEFLKELEGLISKYSIDQKQIKDSETY